jgi:hypothetical protein
MLPVNLTTASIDIDIGESVPSLALPQPANDVESDDNENGEVRRKEGFGIHGSDGNVKLLLLAYTERMEQNYRSLPEQ